MHLRNINLKAFAALILLLNIVPACGGSSGSGDGPELVEDPENILVQPPEPEGRVWTVAEILTEPRRGGSGRNNSCGGEFGFRRCVCAPDVPADVRYRPAVAECNGNAAAILSGRYLDIFSVVVRDTQNRDRWPESGFNGCSLQLATSAAPPNKCSAFKVQDAFAAANGTVRVYCFGASGYSDLFSDVVRMTIKITDSPFSNDDEIDRLCLAAPDQPLN